MNKYRNLILLVLSMGVTCGFNWGFGSTDACLKVKALLPALADLSGAKRTKQEDRILKLCPDGAAGHFVLGLRHERQGEISEAIDEYRATVENDETLAEAHGNLGLLLLDKGARDEAAVELTKGLMGKANPRYHRGLAPLLREGKMYSLALFHYHEALKAFPLDVSIHAGLADTYYKLNRLDEAEKEFKIVLVADPTQVNARLGLAEVYKKGKRFDEAIVELHKVASAKPRDKEIHKLLAEVYRTEGDLAQAGKEYLLAGIEQPSSLDEYIHKGDEYLLSREYGKAIEKYQDAVIKRPDWTKALEKLGDAHMAAGNDDDAIAAYQKVVSLDGGNSGIYYSLGVLFERKGTLDKAVSEYQESLRLDPNNGDPHRRLADIYTLRGNNQQAIEEYKKLIVIRPDNPLLHFKLARVYEKNRDFPESMNTYRAVIKLDPKNVEAHKELAMLYSRRGMAAEAIDQYREVLRLKRNDVEARNALTALFVKQHKYDDLFSLMKEGAELFPKDPGSHYKLGIMHDFRKEYNSAIAEYQQAIALKSDYAKALNALGRTYMKMGKLDKAKETLEAAKKADPDLTETQELLSNFNDEPATDKSKQLKNKHHRLSHPKRGSKVKKLTKRPSKRKKAVSKN